MSELASVDVEQRGDIILLRVRGEIDVSNVRELSAEIEAAVPTGARTVVIDLADIIYLDSAGVKLLLQLADRLRVRRRQLRLVVPESSPIRAVLELTGLPSLIPLGNHVDAEGRWSP